MTVHVLERPNLAPAPALAARMSAPAGPARALLLRHDDTSVVALPGRYCAVYVIVSQQRACAVDVGSAEDLPMLERALDMAGVSSLQWVIATHLHFDHIMGLDAAAARFGARLALGQESRRAVERGLPIRWPRRLGSIRAIPGWVMQGAPTISVRDRERGLGLGFPWSRNHFATPMGPTLTHGVTLPGFEGWTALATPGHSCDSICLYHASSGILVAGDSVRNFRGGEWNALLDSDADYEITRAQLVALYTTVVCPGHGPVLQGEGTLARLPKIGFFGNRVVRAKRA